MLGPMFCNRTVSHDVVTDITAALERVCDVIRSWARAKEGDDDVADVRLEGLEETQQQAGDNPCTVCLLHSTQ